MADSFIPLSAPVLEGNEWRYVKECLDTGWVSSAGSFVGRFEGEFAAAIGAKGAVCTSSGTSALHVAMLLAGVGLEEEVIVNSMTFIAPVNAIRYVGAWPVFIDSDPASWQMDVDRLAEFLEAECSFDGTVINRTTGRRVTAILPVHILGYAGDCSAISALAGRFGLRVIEDATESLGARYGRAILGSNSRMNCFSFNGNKLITTGGGGMFVSNDEDLLEYAKHLTTQARSAGNEYVHDEVGYNYRLPNLLAAVGCAQVEQLSRFLAAKQAISERYDLAFGDCSRIRLIKPVAGSEPAPWLYTIRLDGDSRPLVEHLRAMRIESRPLWEPNHLSQAHADAQRRDCPVAEELYRECISLPCSSNLRENDQDRVIDVVLGFLAN